MGTSKGYRQHSQYGYYDDDIVTEDYATRYRQKQVYDERINGNEDKEDSDWSEDEQLGVVDDYSSYVEMPESNKKSKPKKKKRKKNKDMEYDVNVNDVDSMPIHSNQSGNDDDAIEVQIHSKENADYDQFYEQNETLRDEDLESDKED